VKTFEDIINLMHPQPDRSVSLEQHCSAMRMDDLYNWTSNQLGYALLDAQKALA
jgi:hypothetical protein